MKLDFDLLLNIAEYLATKTTSKVDDALVNLLREVLEIEAIRGWLNSLTGQEVATAGLFDGLREYRDLVDQLQPYLPLILQLLKLTKRIQEMLEQDA